MTPPNRYILNAEHLTKFKLDEQVESISDLKGSGYYRPFDQSINLSDAKILVERHRSRGIGDLLFMTGPLSYIYYLSGGTAKIYVKSLVDRGTILAYHPTIHCGTTLYGPTYYDTLPLYRYHWFIESVTELDEEPEQLNVYDALFRQLGFNPDSVDPKFKRPSVAFDASDHRSLHIFYKVIWSDSNIDLRTTAYYVVAPFSHGQLRTKSYGFWLELIGTLMKRRPVIVIGGIRSAVPSADDMTMGEFHAKLEELRAGQPQLISLIGETPLRIILSIISGAKCVIGLDSAPIYMAQACRVPAISLWGTHDPSVRLKYDPEYLQLAIWNRAACVNSPCFSYSGLPVEKCPRGVSQKSCEVLASVTSHDVLTRLDSFDRL